MVRFNTSRSRRLGLVRCDKNIKFSQWWRVEREFKIAAEVHPVKFESIGEEWIVLFVVDERERFELNVFIQQLIV